LEELNIKLEIFHLIHSINKTYLKKLINKILIIFNADNDPKFLCLIIS